MTNKNKIFIGLSGGVDSAVSAYLLKQQGYDVEAVFMTNWDPLLNHEENFSTSSPCNSELDFEFARKIADTLKIKIHRVNFIKEYWEEVFIEFLNQYKSGKTPNPDILCNQTIKFKHFFNYIKKNFGDYKIATGHYASIKTIKDKHYLELCKDRVKDQTYFLSKINPDSISSVCFPLSNFLKKDVKVIANQVFPFLKEKKESMGICFIGKRPLKEFLSNYLPIKKGKIVDIDTQEFISEHDGYYFYTIGQRKSLNLGGNSQKSYVCAKDISKNIIYVTQNTDRLKHLSIDYCELNDIIIYERFSSIEAKVKFRHSSDLHDAKIILDQNSIKVFFNEQKVGPVPGQNIAIYKDDICIASGTIDCAFLKGVKKFL